MRVSAVIALLVTVCACDHSPDSYPIPPQHISALPDSDPSQNVIDMGGPDAAVHFVRDIKDFSGSSWRWTGQRPTVSVLVTNTDHLKFVADFALWDLGMQQTGPVTISFLVDGKQLDKIHYGSPGVKHFEKLVPAEWLDTITNTEIAAEIDKLYVAPKDGARFGFILVRMGLAGE